jgi:predicted LPLAT superfamily acyltransferase
VSRAWLRQPEQGSYLALRLITWIATRFGRRLSRVLLYPISAYFVLFSHASRRASLDYLQRVRAQAVNWLDVFRHYYYFASTLLDRIYFLSGQHDLFEIQMHGAEIVQRQGERGQGCLLLGSHLGSFDAMRALGILQQHLSIKVLMYEENAKKINTVLNAINPAMTDSVIAIGAPDALLKVKEEIDRGTLVGILGDRVMFDDRVISATFFGKKAVFPGGPMMLASALKVPVVLCFGLYRGGNRYDIYFELLAECIEINRLDREKEVTNWTQKYVDRLEHYCRLAPYNWFNFYMYWDKDATRPN